MGPSFVHEDTRFQQYFTKLLYYINSKIVISSLNSGILWRPGEPSNGNKVATWAEVMQLINSNDGDITIYIDNSIAPCIVPVGIYDLKGHVTFSPHIFTVNPIGTSVDLVDGAVLKNLAALEGPCGLISNNTMGPALIFDLSPMQVFGLTYGAVLKNDGTKPMIVVSGSLFALGLQTQSELRKGTNDVPIVHVNSGLFIINNVVRGIIDSAYGNYVSGDPGSDFVCQYDSNFVMFPTPLWNGNPINEQLFSNSISEKYDDSILNPQIGSNRVQGAIDALKPGFGLLINRPPTPYNGQFYFAIDQGANGTPVWWNGAVWVDANSIIIP